MVFQDQLQAGSYLRAKIIEGICKGHMLKGFNGNPKGGKPESIVGILPTRVLIFLPHSWASLFRVSMLNSPYYRDSVLLFWGEMHGTLLCFS